MDQHKKKLCALVALKDIMHSFCFDVKVNLGNMRTLLCSRALHYLYRLDADAQHFTLTIIQKYIFM